MGRLLDFIRTAWAGPILPGEPIEPDRDYNDPLDDPPDDLDNLTGEEPIA